MMEEKSQTSVRLTHKWRLSPNICGVWMLRLYIIILISFLYGCTEQFTCDESAIIENIQYLDSLTILQSDSGSNFAVKMYYSLDSSRTVQIDTNNYNDLNMDYENCIRNSINEKSDCGYLLLAKSKLKLFTSLGLKEVIYNGNNHWVVCKDEDMYVYFFDAPNIINGEVFTKLNDHVYRLNK